VYKTSIPNSIVLRGSGKETDGRMFALGTWPFHWLHFTYTQAEMALLHLVYVRPPPDITLHSQRCQLASAFWKTREFGYDIL